ncbi:MAG: hypothetical protein CM15mP31_5030 [Gammaproteobacteria bacterium]|nr:MAG: hypothetical protein CM15mP31_5030 [Gammaproteobacteria bacterium]
MFQVMKTKMRKVFSSVLLVFPLRFSKSAGNLSLLVIIHFGTFRSSLRCRTHRSPSPILSLLLFVLISFPLLFWGLEIFMRLGNRRFSPRRERRETNRFIMEFIGILRRFLGFLPDEGPVIK